jgi:hypothetical protein
MGLTGILLIVVLALLAIMVKFVVDGIREKNWIKVLVSIVVFLGIILLLYFGLIRLITAM